MSVYERSTADGNIALELVCSCSASQFADKGDVLSHITVLGKFVPWLPGSQYFLFQTRKGWLLIGYLPPPQDSRASHPTFWTGTTGVRNQLQKLQWHGHYCFCVSVLHYIAAQSTGLQIPITALTHVSHWLQATQWCISLSTWPMDVWVTQRLTQSIKHVWNLQPHHGLKNTFKPPGRDIFRGRRVEMAFGTNSKPIISTNIWHTGFHCMAILSFPLMLFNFLFVTCRAFHGRSCVPHLLQQYHLGVVQRPGQPGFQPSQLLETWAKVYFNKMT